MRATIEHESRERSDCEFEGEKRQVAVGEYAGHERVSLGGDIQMDPQYCELGIEPVEAKQQ
jgi:hypothetical protein